MDGRRIPESPEFELRENGDRRIRAIKSEVKFPFSVFPVAIFTCIAIMFGVNQVNVVSSPWRHLFICKIILLNVKFKFNSRRGNGIGLPLIYAWLLCRLASLRQNANLEIALFG